MPILFSSIHAALGVTGPLDYALVRRAVEERVAEDEHLDWKRTLPSDGDEVAKDVAALANSRGGLLVYGVAEDQATARAAAPMPVSLAEAEQRRIRSWLGTRVNPMVAGVEFIPLPSPESDTDGFLVVSVPESPDAPHLVGKDNAVACPYRVGAQTLWMREWDLERAYRQRFERRASDETRLSELIEHVRDQVDLNNGCWLVGAARPSILVPETLPVPDSRAAVRVIERSLQVGVEIAPVSDRRAEVIRTLDNAALNPRVGFRRWVFATRTEQVPENRSDQVHVELLHDGSLVLALRTDGRHYHSIDGKNCLPDFVVTGFAVDLVASIEAMAEATGLASQTLLRVDLLRSDDAPFAFLAPERRGLGLSQPYWTRDVRRFMPVQVVAPRATEIEQKRDIVRTIATDIVTQFGFRGPDLQW